MRGFSISSRSGRRISPSPSEMRLIQSTHWMEVIMAKIELSKDGTGITLEASYFMSGVIVIFIGFCMFLPLVTGVQFPTTHMVKT